MAGNGPDGLCPGGCHQINFSPRQALPPGWSVWWHEEHEHYQAHGPNGQESAITCRRWAARRSAILGAEAAAETP